MGSENCQKNNKLDTTQATKNNDRGTDKNVKKKMSRKMSRRKCTLVDKPVDSSSNV